MFKRLLILAVSILALLMLSSCKNPKFSIAEEVNNNIAIRYKTTKSHYTMGKSIALTQGKFVIVPGDSTVLYVEGISTKSTEDGHSIAKLALAKTARFYIMLPTNIRPGTYNTTHRAICEMMGSLNYNIGENLFTCQSGEVIVDSLIGSEVFGTMSGTYRNTKDQTLKVTGAIKAKSK